MIPAVHVFWVQKTCKGVQRSKLFNWREYLPFCEVQYSFLDWWTQYIRVNYERGGIAANTQCWFCVLSNPCMKIQIHNKPLLYLPRVVSSFLIQACIACSQINLISCPVDGSKPFYVLMMSPHCRYFYTVTLQVCNACLRLCQKPVIWTAPHRKAGFC